MNAVIEENVNTPTVRKTAKQIREELSRRGMSIAAWADANALPRMTVYNILYGRLVGTRGNAHRAAVLLGLKDGEIS